MTNVFGLVRRIYVDVVTGSVILVCVFRKSRSLHGIPVSLKYKHVVFNCYDRTSYFSRT